jgi:hypothetical protein
VSRAVLIIMVNSVEEGKASASDYCALVLVFFLSWLTLLMYQNRFHSEDVYTNIM